MKVRVEMDLPVGCKECPFYYPGKEYDICYFPNDKHRLSEYDVSDCSRPNACPLNECTQVDDDRTAVIKMMGGIRCEECIFVDENGKCGHNCSMMDGRVSGGIGGCTAGIKNGV